MQKYIALIAVLLLWPSVNYQQDLWKDTKKKARWKIKCLKVFPEITRYKSRQVLLLAHEIEWDSLGNSSSKNVKARPHCRRVVAQSAKSAAPDKLALMSTAAHPKAEAQLPSSSPSRPSR